ncbi:MAG: hypothetical protein GY941_19910 [Planctomycetes bacterium]|nr:hypothetical protein [Planctomycetota bacterium]
MTNTDTSDPVIQAPRIWGIHGIWTKGTKSVDPCGQILQREYGIKYLNYDYPYNRLIQQRNPFLLRNNATALATAMQDGDHILAHSNGASIVYEALRQNPRVTLGCIILVAPAFGATTSWQGKHFKRMLIMYNRYDRAILAGQYLYKHKFGALGRLGYRGNPDYRIDGMGIHNAWGADWPMNHSWMFGDNAVDKTSRLIANFINRKS